MQHGFVITQGTAEEFVELAELIEASGWDGAFGWEVVYGLDPWVIQGAMAVKTSHVKLGPLLTPPSRRRPWKLASEVATVDLLSNGRAVLMIGLGDPGTGLADVGEEIDRRTRAELVDESIDLMRHFWSGEPFTYEGKHYQVDWSSKKDWDVTPVQQPPPIWTVALWPHEKSMSRAFRVEGVLPYVPGETPMHNAITAEHVAAIRAAATERKGPDTPFDIVMEGVTPIGDTAALDKVRTFRDAGATWWIESMWGAPGGVEALKERIKAGPPEV
ncbi:MAG: LLM class flavin-dependent oxidoreductase [Thermomicrobiales bacterium]|nr:LLM class flavin-dependent oxidoreductase [Thermomicrobiales bacterium]